MLLPLKMPSNFGDGAFLQLKKGIDLQPWQILKPYILPFLPI